LCKATPKISSTEIPFHSGLFLCDRVLSREADGLRPPHSLPFFSSPPPDRYAFLYVRIFFSLHSPPPPRFACLFSSPAGGREVTFVPISGPFDPPLFLGTFRRWVSVHILSRCPSPSLSNVRRCGYCSSTPPACLHYPSFRTFFLVSPRNWRYPSISGTLPCEDQPLKVPLQWFSCFPVLTVGSPTLFLFFFPIFLYLCQFSLSPQVTCVFFCYLIFVFFFPPGPLTFSHFPPLSRG